MTFPKSLCRENGLSPLVIPLTLINLLFCPFSRIHRAEVLTDFCFFMFSFGIVAFYRHIEPWYFLFITYAINAYTFPPNRPLASRVHYLAIVIKRRIYITLYILTYVHMLMYISIYHNGSFARRGTRRHSV